MGLRGHLPTNRHIPPAISRNTSPFGVPPCANIKAAVVYDALAINKHIVNQRQKLYHERTNGAAHAAMPGEVGA